MCEFLRVHQEVMFDYMTLRLLLHLPVSELVRAVVADLTLFT